MTVRSKFVCLEALRNIGNVLCIMLCDSTVQSVTLDVSVGYCVSSNSVVCAQLCNSAFETPGKYCTGEEKAHILAWRQENVPMKTIYERAGRVKSTILRLLASASNISPMDKFGGGRRRNTSAGTYVIKTRGLKKNPRLTALELENLHPGLLQNIAVRTIKYRLQKDLVPPCRRVATKPLINDRMEKQRIAFAKKYAP